MGSQPPLVKQWKCICNTWDRLKRMPDDRLNKCVFVWSCSNANNSCKNWVYTVKMQFQNLGHGVYADCNNMFSKTSLVRDVSNVMLQKFTDDWLQSLNQVDGNRGRGLISLELTRHGDVLSVTAP